MFVTGLLYPSIYIGTGEGVFGQKRKRFFDDPKKKRAIALLVNVFYETLLCFIADISHALIKCMRVRAYGIAVQSDERISFFCRPLFKR